MSKRKINIAALSFVFLFVLTPKAFSNPHRYSVDNKSSSLKCSVHYLILPKIKAAFEDFTGVIYYDPNDITKSSVLMKVKTKSIKTGNARWDRVIRSRRILDATDFPTMVYKSSAVFGTTKDLSVDGSLDLHGKTKNKLFHFYVEGPFIGEKGEYIIARGTWVINRKEFGIIWSKTLDKGGIIVGNNVIIDWKITAYRD